VAGAATVRAHPRRLAAARAAGVQDERLLAVMACLPRVKFVPADEVRGAYRDEPVRISHEQVTTQPSLVATMAEALALAGDEKVLEVGTGYGYQTAILANLANEVWSIELWPDMTEVARRALAAQRLGNVHLIVGDGNLGLPDQAPFDAIIVTAAFPQAPRPLADQLARRGRLVQPVGPGGREEVVLFTKDDQRLIRVRTLVPASFVRLYGEHGYPLEPAVGG
jgi:protein-L-isoaspartate(D-aspartate) O-methyltransferase